LLPVNALLSRRNTGCNDFVTAVAATAVAVVEAFITGPVGGYTGDGGSSFSLYTTENSRQTVRYHHHHHHYHPH